MLCAAVVVRAGDLQITVEKKRTDAGAGRPMGSVEQKKETKWLYQVKVANNSFTADPALQARYMIFLQRQNMGGKMNETTIESVKGSAPLQAVAAHGNASFQTSEFTLKEQVLAAGWVYASGGSTKAQDGIAGVWIKLFDGDKLVAEYKNPSTIDSKQQWAQ